MDRFEGHGPRVGRRQRVLPVGSRRRVERVVVRHEVEEADADHEIHGLRREDDRLGPRRCRLRTGGLRARARSEERAVEGRHHQGHGGLPVDDAALGRRDEPHEQHRAVPDGQADRRRGARRGLHDSRREGGRAQPESLERVRRARSGMVPRRQVRLVLQRQVRRVQADHRGAGGAQAAARDRSAKAHALLHAGVVSGFEEAALHGYEPERLGARRREWQAEGRRQRPVDGAAADVGPHVEPRLEMGRVRQPPELALSRDLREQRRDRREETDHRRPRRRHVPGVGRERQVRLVPGLHGLRAAIAVARHDVLRPHRELRPVSRGAEEG